jgi:hypothetical protein
MKCALEWRERKIDVIMLWGKGEISTQNVNSPTHNCKPFLQTDEVAIMSTPLSQNGSWNNILHLQLPTWLTGITTLCRRMNGFKIIHVSHFICSLHEMHKCLSVCFKCIERIPFKIYLYTFFGLMLFWFVSVQYFVPYFIWSAIRISFGCLPGGRLSWSVPGVAQWRFLKCSC